MSNFAFIDSQNLNLAIRDQNWILDYKKLRIYLKDEFNIEKAYIFIGFIKSNQKLYDHLTKSGYELIFKPTIEEKGKTKGNCDAKLVLQAMIEYENYSKALIISGDGDFYCLIKYLKSQNKLLKLGVPNRKRYSSLLRKFAEDFCWIGDLRKKIEYQKG